MTAHPPVPMLRLASFYFAYYAVLGAFTPYWSLYLQSQGMGIAAISVLMSLWYATRIVAPSTWTLLAARSPRPIRWLRLGCAATLACFSGFLLPWKFAGVFAVMVVFCFFYNAVMPQFESITQSHLHGRTDRYGLIRVWGSIGFILVVAGFGLLIDAFGASWLPWMMLPLLVMLLATAFRNDYAAPPAIPPSGDDAGFRARMRRPETIAFFVAAFLVQVSFGPYYTFFSIYLGEHGYSPSIQGVLWSIGVLVEIGILFLSQRIFRRWGARRLLVFSLGITVLRWWATAAWPDSLGVMVVAQATHAFSFAAFFAAAMLLLAEYFPGRHNGHGQGVFYGLSSGVGGVIGALLAGQLWHFSGRVAFAVSGFIALAACGVAWRWLLRTPPVATTSG